MSVNAIGSFGFSGAGSSSQISQETQNKLKKLGLDPKNYKTEAEAQAAIFAAQSAQHKKVAQGLEGTQQAQVSGSNAMASVQSQVQQLATSVGVQAESNEKIDQTMDKISEKISEIKQSAGTDSTKLSKANEYQAQYDSIQGELQRLNAAKNMTGASAIASYNKFALGLN